MAKKIFINYRREDAKADARNLRDRLSPAFGPANVFMDVDNLAPGQRFDQQLASALAKCDVFLAVIGPRWVESLAARQRSGERDYVREEIAAALSRKILVVPVTIDRAPLPPANALPPDIRALVLHQKLDLSHERFGRDVDDLIATIRGTNRGHPEIKRSNWRKALLASFAGVTVLAGGLFGSGMLDRVSFPAAQSPRSSQAIDVQVSDTGIASREPATKETKAAFTPPPPKRIVAPSIEKSELDFAERLIRAWRDKGLAAAAFPYQWIGPVEDTNWSGVLMQCNVPVAGEGVFFSRRVWTDDFSYASRIDPRGGTLVTGSDEEVVALAKAGNLDCIVQIVSQTGQ